MDRRDDRTWIALELTRVGEQRVVDGDIAEQIRADLGVTDRVPPLGVFVPAVTYTKRGKAITIHLMEGYVFVETGLGEDRYFALERRPYVASVMSSQAGPHRMRVLSVLPNKEIENLRSQLRRMVTSEIEVGQHVRVTEGRFRRLSGKVVYIDGDNALVEFKLRSWNRISPVPRIFLEQVEPT